MHDDLEAQHNHSKHQHQFSSRLNTVDPFSPSKRFWSGLLDSILATALFRCYHILFFFTGWGTLVTLINHHKIYTLYFQSTLLTVVGTVIGFVISYRTTSSFERYNEGRRLWSQIILQTRTFARTVWFHVPDLPQAVSEDAGRSEEQIKARTLVEKKTVINLIEAFAVSVKHYLRGEEGCYYEDLYPLVKFLPAYALPAALPSPIHSNLEEKDESPTDNLKRHSTEHPNHSNSHIPPTSPSSPAIRIPTIQVARPPSIVSPRSRVSLAPPLGRLSTQSEEPVLLPSRMPPEWHIFDVFPFSLFVKLLTRQGKNIKGRKAARLRARMTSGKRGTVVSHNVPLEITLYLSSYISALQRRKSVDVPTTNMMVGALNGLVDALTGLERILTTPIPFSYSIHLWTATTLYCLALPLQIWKTMDWLTIPATSILSFIFFGFLVAGEEIENPFGYDKNDLNLDYFTHSIIRPELMAITSLPTPDPAEWAFSPRNDLVLDAHDLPSDHAGDRTVERATPDEWVARGSGQIRDVLSRAMEHDDVVVP